MSTHVIRYITKSTMAADENQELVEKVFAQLNAEHPGGIRYATFRLGDGVTFVHVLIHETEENPLDNIPAFADFQRGIGGRVSQAPVFHDATLIGSYRFVE